VEAGGEQAASPWRRGSGAEGARGRRGLMRPRATARTTAATTAATPAAWRRASRSRRLPHWVAVWWHRGRGVRGRGSSEGGRADAQAYEQQRQREAHERRHGRGVRQAHGAQQPLQQQALDVPRMGAGLDAADERLHQSARKQASRRALERGLERGEVREERGCWTTMRRTQRPTVAVRDWVRCIGIECERVRSSRCST